MRLLVFLFCSLLLSIIGCEQHPLDDQRSGLHSEITDPATGTMVSMSTLTSSAGIADRIKLNVSVSRPETVSYSFEINKSLEEAGWTIISESKKPTSVQNNLYTTSWTYLLEPFLDGTYQIPDLEIQLGSEAEHRLICEGFSIEILPAVSNTEQLELTELATFHAPSSETDQEAVAPWLVALLIGAGFVGLLFILRPWNRRVLYDPEQHVIDELKQIAQGIHQDQAQAFRVLHTSLLSLDHYLQHTSEITRLIQQCEHNRYNRPEFTSSADSPEQIAQHTLDLIDLQNERVG